MLLMLRKNSKANPLLHLQSLAKCFGAATNNPMAVPVSCFFETLVNQAFEIPSVAAIYNPYKSEQDIKSIARFYCRHSEISCGKQKQPEKKNIFHPYFICQNSKRKRSKGINQVVKNINKQCVVLIACCFCYFQQQKHVRTIE